MEKIPVIRLKNENGNYNPTFILMIVVFTLTVLGIGVANIAERYVDWRAEHQWQRPVEWVGFVKYVPRPVYTPQSEEVAVLTDFEIIEQYRLSPIIKSIYFLESTFGQNDGCKEAGMFNGYGYRQNSFEWRCYDSFDQVTEKVNEWLEERLMYNGNDVIEAVCFYNTGVAGQKTCNYSQKFATVIVDNL